MTKNAQHLFWAIAIPTALLAGSVIAWALSGHSATPPKSPVQAIASPNITAVPVAIDHSELKTLRDEVAALREENDRIRRALHVVSVFLEQIALEPDDRPSDFSVSDFARQFDRALRGAD